MVDFLFALVLINVLYALLNYELLILLCVNLLYFLVRIVFSWLLVLVFCFTISTERYSYVFSVLHFLGLGRHYLERLFLPELVYLLKLISHIVIAVSVTFFVCDFPFFKKCFANLQESYLLNLQRKVYLRFRYIDIVLVLLHFLYLFVYKTFGLCLLVILLFFPNLWLIL